MIKGFRAVWTDFVLHSCLLPTWLELAGFLMCFDILLFFYHLTTILAVAVSIQGHVGFQVTVQPSLSGIPFVTTRVSALKFIGIRMGLQM